MKLNRWTALLQNTLSRSAGKARGIEFLAFCQQTPILGDFATNNKNSRFHDDYDLQHNMPAKTQLDRNLPKYINSP